MNTDLTDTLTDAEHAHMSVGALVELLGACPVGHKITAGAILGLVVSVKMHLDNVVDGLRVVQGAAGPTAGRIGA